MIIYGAHKEQKSRGALTLSQDLHLQAQAPAILQNDLKINKLKPINSQLTNRDQKRRCGGHRTIKVPELSFQ